MTGRTHDLAAFTTLAVLTLVILPAQTLSLGTVLAAILANQIGGILPDIDQPTAPLWRTLPVGRVFGKVFDKLIGGHRFLTHSVVGVLLFSALMHLLLVFIHPLIPQIDTNLVWWAFIIGIVSHLVMDSFTKEGVPWLLPLPFKFGFPPLRSLRLTTGKFIETVIIFPGLIVVNIWLFASHYGYILNLLHYHIV